MKLAPWIAALALPPLSAGAALAQTPITLIPSPHFDYTTIQDNQFGHSVDRLGVLSGQEAFLVGAPELAPGTGGRVYVYAARSGEVLAQLPVSGPGSSSVLEQFGRAVAGLGDVDGDGEPDFAVGSISNTGPGPQDLVTLYSGADFQIIRNVAGYDGFGPGGDVDADGHADLLVFDTADVRVLSGLDGKLLLNLRLAAPPVQAVGLGDVNGDGSSDVAVLSLDPDLYLTVHSGSDGEPLLGFGIHALGLPEDGAQDQATLSAAGDANADGYPDLAIALPSYGPDDIGWVSVHSGVDGGVIHGGPGDFDHRSLGARMKPAGDLDGDGRDDLLTSFLYPDFGGAVLALSGADGSILYTSAAPWMLTEPFVSDFAGAGDVDGDGHDDVLLADEGNGAVAVCAARVLPLHAEEAAVWVFLRTSQGMQLDAGPERAGAIYLVLGTMSGVEPGLPVGSLHLPLNLDAYSLHILGNPGQAPLPGALGTLDAAGQAMVTFTPMPAMLPDLAWRTLHHAFLVADPLEGVVELSNALPVVVMPL